MKIKLAGTIPDTCESVIELLSLLQEKQLQNTPMWTEGSGVKLERKGGLSKSPREELYPNPPGSQPPPSWRLMTVAHEFHDIFQKGPFRMWQARPDAAYLGAQHLCPGGEGRAPP